MPDTGINLILGVDAIRPPLTGIGRYAWELAFRLPHLPDIADARFYANGRFVDDPRTLLDQVPLKLAMRGRLVKNRLAIGAYRRLAPLIHRSRLRALDDFLFHGPNFYLPDFPGRAVATIHDLSIYRHPQYHPPARVAFMRKEIPLTLKRADLLITDSEYIRREVIDAFGVPESGVVAIPLAAREEYRPRDGQETASVLANHGLVHGKYALCVSTIEPRKNIAALVRAYARLPSGLRTAYPLVLAGDRGWLSEDVHAEIDRARAQGWLHYFGYVADDDLPYLYAGARGFALPSLYEGFGLPVLEALASGIPVLTSRDSALSEIAAGAAWLVDPLDDDAIRDGLQVLLEDEAWRKDASQNGIGIAGRYSWGLTALRTIEAYRKACGTSQAP